MIEEIVIRNLGVIGEAQLPLGSGFTAITGETGAGKTMVVTALGLLLGSRADSQVVRAGSGQATVEGRWQVDETGIAAERVRDAGGEVEPFGSENRAELLLTRTITEEGRSRATAGGRSAPIGVLTELGEHLVVVHGQSDQIRLKSQTAQRDALDRFAGSAVQSVLTDYQQAYRSWQAAREELDRLTAERDDRAREAEQLRQAIDEIQASAPEPGEDTALAERAERLSNLEDLRIAAVTAHGALVDDDSSSEGMDATALVEQARRALDRVAGHDPALAPVVEALATVSFQLADAAVQLSGYLDSLDADGSRELEVVQERRAVLATLIRKYGPTLDDVIDYLDTGSARLLELDNDGDRIEQLQDVVTADFAVLEQLGDSLTRARSAAGERLAAEVTEELAALAMPDARLVVEVADKGEFTLGGKDQVQLLLQPHPGASPRPLGKGASGGELSRVMLAIEVVIAANDPVPTFIFDEVDAGVGGASAIEIGRRLARLADTAQVIVVTHLAQVAAFATNHLRVVKDSDGAVTASSVRQLDGDERVEEMARLLSGLSDSESGLAHARELLELAETRTRG
ncbi:MULTISPECIES: DNA repair protein RecN [unclassified Diaminobutyricimonas]|uniref:DNA repair protein RecN n=1 Tax=unclassified Diaminobutyricimonas TaxID=2643261 RepID=UPI0012F4D56E|nr:MULTISPECIES: DNA repair protein RecN [unclassified Diaminobutyricimonas]